MPSGRSTPALTATSSKRSSADELMAAVQAVLKDETYITQGFAVRVIDALRNTDVRHRVAEAIKLSQREGRLSGCCCVA